MSSNALKASLVGLALSGATTVAIADEYSTMSVQQAPAVNIVNEMLLIDARRSAIAEREKLLEALGRKKDKTPTTVAAQPSADPRPNEEKAPPKQPDSPPPVVLDLQGIFGLGNNLFADVSINGQVVRFQRGRALPLGMADYKFHLSSIEVPCVKLIQGQTIFNTCLAKSGL